MQYLKEEIRNRIIATALKEFKEKGYNAASIRNIAKNSGTSVGNLYKYFLSKDDLYEHAIGKVYKELLNYFSQIKKVEINEKTERILSEFLDKILELFEQSSTELSVLLNQSEGSKYENCKNVFIEFITKTVADTMNYELSLKGLKLKDNYLLYLLSNNLVESISLILRDIEDVAEVKRLILNILDIFYAHLAENLENEAIIK